MLNLDGYILIEKAYLATNSTARSVARAIQRTDEL